MTAAARGAAWRRRSTVAALVAVLAAAAGLRLVGSDWDAGAQLHPDERYMAIVADNVDWPSGVREYFDVGRSPLSSGPTSMSHRGARSMPCTPTPRRASTSSPPRTSSTAGDVARMNSR